MLGQLFDGGLDAYVITGDSNRRYLTGILTSFGCVILTQSGKHFITDSRYAVAAEAALPDWKLHVITGKELYRTVGEIVSKSGARCVGVECDALSYNEYCLLRDTLDGITLTACDGKFAELRAIKTDREIACIETAQKINETALSKVFSLIKPKMTERDLYAEYVYQAFSAGADEMAFEPIVAAGAAAAEPHHKVTDGQIAHGEPILFDVGVKRDGYCSDLSRTICFGAPSKEMAEVYEAVSNAQVYALSKIKAGITCHEADSYAREHLAADGYGQAFTHSLGHGVGLAIHEFPGVAKGSDVILRPNMVITVEPGVYLPGIGGVRIEDTVVVTEDGIRNLTTLHKKFQI